MPSHSQTTHTALRSSIAVSAGVAPSDASTIITVATAGAASVIITAVIAIPAARVQTLLSSSLGTAAAASAALGITVVESNPTIMTSSAKDNDNNDFGIVGSGLVDKVHVLSAKGGAQGTIQRWAVLAEGEECKWNDGDGAVLGGLVVCKLVSTHKSTAGGKLVSRHNPTTAAAATLLLSSITLQSLSAPYSLDLLIPAPT